MANIAKKLVHKTLFSGKGNLVSFDEPYRAIALILRRQHVGAIIDAGASSGRISLRLLRSFPEATAYAFEPNPLYRESLLKQAVADRRFKPQFLVLSDSEGTASLNIAESPGITSLFMPARNLRDMYPGESAIKEIVRVESVTIDDWADRSGVNSVELMKFDIQGAELKALRGARRMLTSSTLAVYTELLFNPLYEGGALYSEVDLFLRDVGFVLFDLYKPRYDKQGKLLWANALFVHAGRLGL
jgi:FkbM family methyltransferase